MTNILQYAKTIAALLGAILTSVSASIPETPLWVTIALAIASAVAVFAVPNAVTPAQRDEVSKHGAL
jgi:hypothetical protein